MALFRCMTCPDMLCKDCVEYHKALKATRNHEILDIKSFKAWNEFITGFPAECAFHQPYVAGYYCYDHEVRCCEICLRKAHRRCFTKPDNCLGNTAADKISTTKATINSLIKECDISLGSNEQGADELATTQELFLDDLKAGRAAIDRYLNSIERHAEDNFKHDYTKAQKRVQEERKVLEENKKFLTKQQDLIGQLGSLHIANNQKIAIANHLATESNKKIQNQLKVPKTRLKHGKVFEINADDNLIKIFPYVAETSAQGAQAALPDTPKFKFHHKFFVERRNTDVLINSVKLVGDSLVVMAESSQDRIMVYQTNGQKKGELVFDETPEEMAVMDNFCVAVGVKKKMFFFDAVDIVLEREIYLRDYIFGLAYANGFVFANRVQQGVAQVNQSGQIVRNFSFLKGKFYLCATPDEVLYTVKFIGSVSLMEYKVYENSRTFIDLPEYSVAVGIHCDHHGGIYIGTGSAVMRYDRKVRSFSTLLSEIDGIQNIAVSKDGKQIVAVVRNGRELAFYRQ